MNGIYFVAAFVFYNIENTHNLHIHCGSVILNLLQFSIFDFQHNICLFCNFIGISNYNTDTLTQSIPLYPEHHPEQWGIEPNNFKILQIFLDY